ncbi:MAG: Uma2 family endonuclease [Polyangiales bacterium]
MTSCGLTWPGGGATGCRRLYAQAGIPFYWLIDPELRAVEALALRDGVWVELGVFDDTATARIAPFDAIELEIGRLFLPKEADEI